MKSGRRGNLMECTNMMTGSYRKASEEIATPPDFARGEDAHRDGSQ
jgi:hypothetical protein